MRLAVRRWGSGPRTVALVHGFSDDASTWWQVGPALADLGCTVLAPDLRGHGRSPRCPDYRLADIAGDLVDTLPQGADLVLGHSLGALVLGLAAPQLAARRTVFVDPPWRRPLAGIDLTRPLPLRQQDVPAGLTSWSAEEMAVELASNALLDPRVGADLERELTGLGELPAPPVPEAGSVVLVPELEPVLPLSAHPELLALGYAVLTQPGVRHVLHRDDLTGFLDLLRPQLTADVAA